MGGQAADQEQIYVDVGNEDLTNAKWHYKPVDVDYNGKLTYYCRGCGMRFYPDGTPVLLEQATVVTLPDQLSYLTGDAVKLTGIVLNAVTPDGVTVKLMEEDIASVTADLSTPGRKTVAVEAYGAVAEFEIIVHGADEHYISVDPSRYPESTHDYGNYIDVSKTFTYSGARYLILTFSSQTALEQDRDFLYIYDGNDNLIARYTGTEAAGETMTVSGDTFRIRLYSNYMTTDYGYSFASITAVMADVIHPPVTIPATATCTQPGLSEGSVCEICGLVLVQQTQVDFLPHDFGAWETVKKENYLENGLKERHCSRCEMVELGVISNNPFPDVGAGNSFKTYILWNYYEGIIGGDKQGNFNPDKTVTRGQFIIMLWRAAGKPDPTQFKAFPDVSENSSFYMAVCWAVEQGITNGKKDGNFGVNDPCTRGHVALFLYRYAGTPNVHSNVSFPDVTGGTYYKAVCWMVEKGITNGQKDGTFGVGNACKRTHVTKFLYLYLN